MNEKKESLICTAVFLGFMLQPNAYNWTAQALWFMRQPNMNEKKESLICTAVFLDSCCSLTPKIRRCSLTQTGAVFFGFMFAAA